VHDPSIYVGARDLPKVDIAAKRVCAYAHDRQGVTRQRWRPARGRPPIAQRGSGPDPPPREVVAQAKEGSAEARARLIGYYYQPVRTFLRRQGGDPERSDDLAHDAFVYALAHLDELDRDTSFRAWLYRIARSRAGQEWRCPERTREVPLAAAADVPAPQPSPMDERVRDALAALSPALREALEGHGMHGEPLHRLAARTNRSVAAVKKNFTRAKDRFAEVYVSAREEGRDDGDGG